MKAVVRMTTGSQGYTSIFNKMEKIEGNGEVDFASWLRSFDRCCTIAQKDDDLVKGQILMLCLSGQALAIAEQLEQEKQAQQKFSELKPKLESVFTTESIREASMVKFENRIQQIQESEDEFMLSLVKLYKAANPDASSAVTTKAIKRRFMNGISANVRQSIYIFCNDPHASTVSYQRLLEHARKARMHVDEGNKERQSVNLLTTSCSNSSVNNESILTAISNLSSSLNQRIDTIEQRSNTQMHEINAITRGRGNYRGNYSRYRNNRRGFYSNRGTSNNLTHTNVNRTNEPSQDNLKCYKCNGLNHFARYCRAKNV